jgi:hypothetical protein
MSELTAGLDRLAQLDSRSLTAPPYLLAFRDGELAAALSQATGEITADPFRRTVELQQLLRCHAGRVDAPYRILRRRHTVAATARPLSATG